MPQPQPYPQSGQGEAKLSPSAQISDMQCRQRVTKWTGAHHCFVKAALRKSAAGEPLWGEEGTCAGPASLGSILAGPTFREAAPLPFLPSTPLRGRMLTCCHRPQKRSQPSVITGRSASMLMTCKHECRSQIWPHPALNLQEPPAKEWKFFLRTQLRVSLHVSLF